MNQHSIAGSKRFDMGSNQRYPDLKLLLAPLALVGLLVEAPLVWVHQRLAARRRWLATWYGLLFLTLAAPVPARADFLGFDLIPLAGSLLVDIRNFYLEYQKQITILKKMALAYYATRLLDTEKLKRELGDLAELELAEAMRHWVNRPVTGYVHALTYTGESRNTGADPSAPAGHDGQWQKGLRFRVEDNDGQARYMTNSEIWNALFNPYDPAWDPALTHETYLVLKARSRWLSRELGRYRRAIFTWQKLAAIYDNLYLEGIEGASTAAAIRWASGAGVQLDRVAARIQSMNRGPLKHYIEGRVKHWQTRVAEVRLERVRIREAIAEMRADMTAMERRALGMVAARIKQTSLRNWNYGLPPTGPPGPNKAKTGLPLLSPQHWSLFPLGWGSRGPS